MRRLPFRERKVSQCSLKAGFWTRDRAIWRIILASLEKPRRASRNPGCDRRGHGAAVQSRTARPRAPAHQLPPGLAGPRGCPCWPPSPCLRGTATAGTSGLGSTGSAGGGTEADRVRALRRQRPPPAGRPGPRLSSSPYSTCRSWGVRGQLIPDLSQQSLTYKKRNPHVPLTLARCAPTLESWRLL